MEKYIALPISAAICGAQHFIAAHESAKQGIPVDFTAVCNGCRCLEQCRYDWLKTAAPLFEETGIYPDLMEEESKAAPESAPQCLPEALKEARHNRQLTRGQVAQAMGLHPKTISAWETGAKTPRPGQLWDLARLYCCDIDELIREVQS